MTKARNFILALAIGMATVFSGGASALAGANPATQAASPQEDVTVTVGALNVRSGPGTGYAVVGSVNDGATVTIQCQMPGTTVTGTYGTSKIWDKIGSGRYIADAYVRTGSDGYVAPRCP